ncbi:MULTISPECIES: PIN domain-containing protein [Asticcacaulis]|uniref:PIN domain-containing protein n=1 Tax=Asticcacaulis TaxID=76890 RepID=UPI001AE1B80F|nr:MULTISPECIES: PIN domain-containing protein [Asticcacaulis]MBP2160912.1 putative nucleic acid-binding protein [Asticcacaulis solisilvae]MDR6801884.1 putative nucleic acid-binding protein [Asticcacaulis sp. BE141]
MTGERAFVDTNILIYALSGDAAKAERVESLFATGGTISVQVLNEMANVMRRKLAMRWEEVLDVLVTIRNLFNTIPNTLAIHDKGLELARVHSLSVYDAMIVAAALDADCTILWSENMQHRFRVGSLEIRNPFLSPG